MLYKHSQHDFKFVYSSFAIAYNIPTKINKDLHLTILERSFCPKQQCLPIVHDVYNLYCRINSVKTHRNDLKIKFRKQCTNAL